MWDPLRGVAAGELGTCSAETSPGQNRGGRAELASWCRCDRPLPCRALLSPGARPRLTSRSRPAATVTMSPVSLLTVNMFWEGLCGLCVRMRYRTMPLAVVPSSASLAVTVIT